jgi:colanic acid biosynthesis protein WcaH
MEKDGFIEEALYEKIRDLMPIASVDVLVFHRRRLLLMLRNNEPGRGLWFVPGGRVRYGETLEEAAIRKLEEETGLIASRFVKVGVMTHLWPQAHYVSTFFRAEVTSDKVKMNDEHADYIWITELNDDLHPYLRTMIKEASIFGS